MFKPSPPAHAQAVDKAKGTIFKLLGPVLLTAKFAGPIVIGAVTYIATPDGERCSLLGTGVAWLGVGG